MGISDFTGVLEAGKQADLLLIEPNYIAIPSEDNLMDLLVFQTNASDIDSVMVDGEFLMKNKDLLTIEEEKALEAVRNIQRKMWPATLSN